MKEKVKIAFAHNNINHNTTAILAGISEYIHSKDNWQLIVWPDSSANCLSFLRQRGCKGAFVSTPTTANIKELLQIGIPVIAITALQEASSLPFVSVNSEMVARLACDYFLKRKFTNFAFFGLIQAKWSLERMGFFSSYLAEAGHNIHVFKQEGISITDNFSSFARLWASTAPNTKQQYKLAEWLRQLPKPAAILAGCDILAYHLINTASQAGLNIPQEIAVLGVNDNQAICNICEPPLSSIALNFKKAGYDAARLLDGLISGRQTMAGQYIDIQPTHIETRGSTDTFATNDSDIVQVLNYIRQNSSKPMQVDEIANHVYISKRSLQIKFRKILGRSIHDEIIQAHFEIAKNLLVETNLSIDRIASQSGFLNTSNMRRTFRHLAGMLPQKYRRQHSIQ